MRSARGGYSLQGRGRLATRPCRLALLVAGLLLPGLAPAQDSLSGQRYFAVENLDRRSVEQRGVTAGGTVAFPRGLILAPGQNYRIWLLDADTLRLGSVDITTPRAGNRTFDFNTEGMIHIGLLPEYIEDARKDATSEDDLDPLFRSAEGYIRMWERTEERGKAFRGE